MRNTQHLAHSKRVIYCDRYYTSVKLFEELLKIGLYAVGTIIPTRVGFCKDIVITQQEKLSRGAMRIAKSYVLGCGDIGHISWQDTKPVNLICTGTSTQSTTIERRMRGHSEKINLPCCIAIKRYQQFMGGVDLHDFYRMARYSTQHTCNFKKWYKAIFASGIDMATTNAYILWKKMHSIKDLFYMTHFEFLKYLSINIFEYKIGTNILTRGQSTKNILYQSIDNNINDGHDLIQFKPGEGYTGRGCI